MKGRVLDLLGTSRSRLLTSSSTPSSELLSLLDCSPLSPSLMPGRNNRGEGLLSSRYNALFRSRSCLRDDIPASMTRLEVQLSLRPEVKFWNNLSSVNHSDETVVVDVGCH